MNFNKDKEVILYVTDVAKPEVGFINKLHDSINSFGYELILITFKTHNANVFKFKPKTICFGTSNIEQLCVGNMGNKMPYIDFNKYFKIDKDLNKASDVNIYRKNLIKLNSTINYLRCKFRIRSALIDNECDGVYEYMVDYLNTYNIKYFLIQRWSFPEYYKLSKKMFDKNITIDKSSINISNDFWHDKVQEFKYKSNDKKIDFEKKNILLLLGGYEVGGGVKSSSRFKSIGWLWGDDFEVVKKVVKIWENEGFGEKYLLIVRQHPNTIYKFNIKDNFHNDYVIDGTDYNLENLSNNADAVICTHTTLVENMILRGKKIAVLGNYEYCNYGLSCFYSSFELNKWIKQLDFKRTGVRDLREVILGYYESNVISYKDASSVERMIHKITALSSFESDNELCKSSLKNDCILTCLNLYNKVTIVYRLYKVTAFKKIKLLMSK